jgi:hypothetical protein
VNPIFDVVTVEMASIFKFHGIVYYQPEMWNEMRMYNFCYPMDTTSNRRLFTRLFQLLLRLLEWHASVRDKYCANDMVTTGDNKEITCMFKPHHMDPAKFKVPETWRKTDQRAERNRIAGINTAMPTPLQIQKSLGTDPVIARKLHKDFVDYAAQRHALFDKRDRAHLDAIANQVENGIAKAKKMHIEQNDFVYISMRAPPGFMSDKMYSAHGKSVQLKKLLTDNRQYNDRLRQLEVEAEIFLEHQSNLAERVQDEIQRRGQDNFRKRPIGTPDGEAASKRTAKADDFAHAAVMAERVGMAEKVAAAARKPDLPKNGAARN